MGVQITATFNFDRVLNLEKICKNTKENFHTLFRDLAVVYILLHLLYHSLCVSTSLSFSLHGAGEWTKVGFQL